MCNVRPDPPFTPFTPLTRLDKTLVSTMLRKSAFTYQPATLRMATKRTIGGMNMLTKKTSGMLLGLLAMAGSSATMAQELLGGSITYGPLGTGVPTLGGVGLLILATLMLGMVWRMLRRSGAQAGRFLTLALLAGGLVSGVGGLKLINDAQAIVFAVYLPNPMGGTEPLPIAGACVENTSGVKQEIKMISVNQGVENQTGGCALNGTMPSEQPSLAPTAPMGVPDCAERMILMPGGVCGTLLTKGGNNG